MRIIVMSDSHGNYSAVESIIDRNTDADWIFHLGDGERELDRYITSHPMIARKIIHVAGNCDFNSMSPDVLHFPSSNTKYLQLTAISTALKVLLSQSKELQKKKAATLSYLATHIAAITILITDFIFSIPEVQVLLATETNLHLVTSIFLLPGL